MREFNVITKLKINFNGAGEIRSAVFVDGRLIISSNFNNSSALCIVDEVTANLSEVFSNHTVKSIDKKEDASDLGAEGFEDFDFTEFQNELFAYCLDHIIHFDGWPMDFEFNNVVFDLGEFPLFLNESVWNDLESRIVN